MQQRQRIGFAIRLAAPPLATALVLGAIACGGGVSGAPTPKDVAKPTVVLPPDQVLTLEASGIPPEDTVITFQTGQPRSIILRHGEPDNTVFVELTFPDSAFAVPKDSLAPRDSVTVVVRPRPGLYAVDIASTIMPQRGATIRFKYPVHFAAPNEAIVRYGTRGRYERALMIGTIVDGTNYGMLPSDRPASDNLRAAITGPGTYIVAAPR